jgi:delta 1-pyrroline-5-carboxylate dehydrogenase
LASFGIRSHRRHRAVRAGAAGNLILRNIIGDRRPQPFSSRLSGTGPKAGGRYLPFAHERRDDQTSAVGGNASLLAME